MYKFEKGQQVLCVSKGFSLIEMVIVLSIVVLLSSIGAGFYVNYGKNIEMNSVAETIVLNLKQAQSKAMIGESGSKWGLHFVNAATDYYEVFSTPTDYSYAYKVILSTNYLSSGAIFSDPVDSSTKDIIFNRISGSTSLASVAIVSFGIVKIINVSSIGIVSVQ